MADADAAIQEAHTLLADVDHLLEQTEEFVETMEELLDADTDKE